MTDRFLTISDAEKFTGKSRSTLRRFIDGIVKVPNAPDRHLLLPTESEVIALREQSQPFAWKISEELLRRQFLKPEEAPGGERGEGNRETSSGESSRLVAVLEKSIALLERELAEKNSQIGAMNERLRESNILMRDLQAKLALPSGSSGTMEGTSAPLDSVAATVSQGDWLVVRTLNSHTPSAMPTDTATHPIVPSASLQRRSGNPSRIIV